MISGTLMALYSFENVFEYSPPKSFVDISIPSAELGYQITTPTLLLPVIYQETITGNSRSVWVSSFRLSVSHASITVAELQLLAIILLLRYIITLPHIAAVAKKMPCQGCNHVNPNGKGTAAGSLITKTYDNNFTQFNGPVGTVIINSPVKWNVDGTTSGLIGHSTTQVVPPPHAPIVQVEPNILKSFLSSPPPSPPPTPPNRHPIPRFASEKTPIESPPAYTVSANTNISKAQLYSVYITSSYPHIFEKSCKGVYEELADANKAALEEYERGPWNMNVSTGGVSKEGYFWWRAQNQDSGIGEGWVERSEA